MRLSKLYPRPGLLVALVAVLGLLVIPFTMTLTLQASASSGCTPSVINSNFNGTAINAGNYLWFNSVLKVSGVGSTPVKLGFSNATIQFSVNGNTTTLRVPDAAITLSPTATSALTSFDSVSNTWVTTAPSKLSGNLFLSGLAYPVASNLPGGINPVSWQGTFTTDTPGISVNWQWAAAVYTGFSSDHTTLGVKPVDDNQLSQYNNSDHAGTPENFKGFVTGGARGGGGSNFTGSYSGTASSTPCPSTPPPTPPAICYDYYGIPYKC